MTQTNVRVQMQIRRDTAANWESADPILLAGEWAYSTDNGKIKIGDGTLEWSSLPYAFVSTKGGNMTDHLTIHNKKELRLSDNTQGTAADHYSAFKAGTQSADLTYTLPTALPTSSGQVLACTDAGIMSWTSDSTTDSTKMPLAGGTFVGDVIFDGATAGRDITYDRSANNLIFNDNAKAIFGTSSDGLEVYHDGSNSYLKNSSGDLLIRGGGDDILIQAENGEPSIKCNPNGAVELSYDGDATPKLQTTSTGITLVDGLKLDNATNASRDIEWQPAHDRLAFFDNTKATFGNTVAFQIYHDSNHGYIKNTTGSLKLNAAAYELGNAAVNENILLATENGSVELFWDGTKKLETQSYGLLSSNQVRVASSSASAVAFSCGDAGTGFYNSGSNAIGYSANGTQKWNINSAGDLRLVDDVKANFGDSTDLSIYHESSTPRNRIDSGGVRLDIDSNDLRLRDSGGENYIKCVNDGAVELFHNNVKTFQTLSTGIEVLGPEGSAAFLYLTADEGDDNADQWRIQAGGNGVFQLKDFTSGTWETNIECNAEGNAELYFDHTLRFHTTSTGIIIKGSDTTGSQVQGDFRFKSEGSGVTKILWDGSDDLIKFFDDSKAVFGGGSDLIILHDGDNSIIKHDGAGTLYISTGSSAEPLYLSAGQNVYIRTSHTDSAITCNTDGAVELFFDDSKKLETSAAGIINAGQTFHSNGNASIFFNQSSGGYGGAIGLGRAGGVNYHVTGSAVGDFVLAAEYEKKILFGATTNTSGAPTIKMTINPGGQIDGNFNDTSDANLKENINLIPDNAINDIKKLKPVTFDWKDSGADNNVSGFIAQDVKEVIPNLINGKEWSEEDQSNKYTINTIGVVAHLTKALQEAITKIERLETTVAALDAK